MSVINSELAEHYNWGESCDGWHLVKTSKLSVIQERVPPNCAENRHYHRNAEQFFFILSGVATMEMDGEFFTLTANDGIHVSAGVKHQISNQHHSDLLFTVTSTPPSHGDRVDL